MPSPGARDVWPKAVPLLILAGLCAYANCYPKAFVFDDDAWVTDRPALDEPWTYFQEMDGRPLLAATNLALHRAGRNNPLGHHVFNVLIHLGATLVLYGVVRRALLSRRFGDRFAGRAPYLAFAIALLWMLHPLQVQCVTYVIQRGESMAGLFYLLILYAMQRADAADPGERFTGSRFGWYALAVVSLALGFGAKEIMVTAPGPVLLFDRIFLARSVREMARRRWLFHTVFLIVWAGFTGWHFQRAAATSGGIGFQVDTVKPVEYALTQTGVLIYYLRLAVWPSGLAIDYQGWPFWRTPAEAMPELAVTLGGLGLTAVLLVWRPAVGFVLAWYFLILIPTSSFLPIVDAVFEHRMYLSLASVAVGVVFLGDWTLRAARLARGRSAVLGVAALALGVLTHLRNEEYRSRAAVWAVAHERMPDSVRARANLAQGLLTDNRPEEVIPLLERAIVLAPTDPVALQNLAYAHEQLGEYGAAAEYYGRLKDYFPAEAKYWRMYGATLLVLQRWEEAAAAYGQAAERARRAGEAASPEPYYARAVAFFALGREADATQELRAAAAADPDWPERVLGTARSVVLDERMRAIPLARQSALGWARLGIRYGEKPHPRHHDTVALCYAAVGDFEKAAQQCQWGLLETPDGPWGSALRDRLRYYREKRVPWE